MNKDEDKRFALAKLREIMKDGDQTVGLRQVISILDEARDLLLSTRAHLTNANPETVFAVGAMMGEFGSLKQLIQRDIAAKKSHMELCQSIEKALASTEGDQQI